MIVLYLTFEDNNCFKKTEIKVLEQHKFNTNTNTAISDTQCKHQYFKIDSKALHKCEDWITIYSNEECKQKTLSSENDITLL